jgi:putative aminopeptidase FrvX
MDKKSKKFLFDYLNNSSPTGFESSGQQIWLDYLKPYINDYMVDVYGTAVGITDDGYIYVRRNGGSDHQIAPSMRVNIYGDKGVVKGVFGWPAIHVRDAAKEETPTLKNIFIDIGAESKKEVEAMGVHVGSVAVFEDELIELNKNYLTGRALDNRMGGYMIAEVARRLHERKKKLPFGLYVVNAVQEEIGLRGAEMISRRLKPDLAICTDVTHDTQSPMYNKKESGNMKCGLGPVLCYGPAVQNNVLKMLIEVAQKKKIPFQRQAVSRSTGTDTDSFAYSAEGVASGLISLPLKYMHTTVETVHKEDVENVINLIYEVLLQVKPGRDFRYIK